MLTDKTEVVDKSCSNVSERILQYDLVENFLNTYFKIYGNYTISDDGVIDIDGNVELKYKQFNHDGLTELPIQFGYIKGWFDFDIANITTLKGFPHAVTVHCSIIHSKNLTSLEYSPNCKSFSCYSCISLISLDGLNCNKFSGYGLNLKRIGINFTAKYFEFNQFPTPTADEMRRFIQLNPEIVTKQQESWIKLIKDYYEHKDLFRVIGDFEALYGEPWVKPEQNIEIINNELSF